MFLLRVWYVLSALGKARFTRGGRNEDTEQGARKARLRKAPRNITNTHTEPLHTLQRRPRSEMRRSGYDDADDDDHNSIRAVAYFAALGQHYSFCTWRTQCTMPERIHLFHTDEGTSKAEREKSCVRKWTGNVHYLVNRLWGLWKCAGWWWWPLGNFNLLARRMWIFHLERKGFFLGGLFKRLFAH